MTDAFRRYSRHHAGGPYEWAAGFVLPPGLVQRSRAEKKGVADGATKDADNAHDDTERSDTMSTKPDGAATMLSIAETVTLVEQGLTEIRTLLFRRKKREKQRR